MQAEPDEIWAVLADPWSYADWVVGSRQILSADPDWPAPGTEFRHKIGLGPLTTSDTTEVLEADPPRRLVLRAKARPLGVMVVVLELEPAGAGTRVTMVEDPEGAWWLAYPPPMHLPMRLRNDETLRRLARAAAERPVTRASSASTRSRAAGSRSRRPARAR